MMRWWLSGNICAMSFRNFFFGEIKRNYTIIWCVTSQVCYLGNIMFTMCIKSFGDSEKVLK